MNPPSIIRSSVISTPINVSFQCLLPIEAIHSGMYAPLSYNVYRNSSLLVNITATNPIIISDSTVSASTTYSYQVSTIDSIGEGSLSSAVSITTPGAVGSTTLTVDPEVMSFNLSWTASTGTGVAYKIEYSTDSFTTSHTIATGYTGLSYTWIAPNTSTYYFRITPHNKYGTGSASTIESGAAVTVPALITPASATSGDGSAALSWTLPGSNPYTSGFNIYQATLNTNYPAPGSPSYSVSYTTNTYSATGLTNNIQYRWLIVPILPTGEYYPNAVLVETTPAATVPNAPTAVIATSACNSIGLTWTAPASGPTPTSYNVYYYTTGSPIYLLSTPNATASATAENGIYPGLNYFFKVTSVSVGGESALSTASSGTVIGTPPAPTITSIVASSSLPATITLHFAAPASGYNYNVYRAIGEQSTPSIGILITTITTSVTSYVDNDPMLVGGLIYYYCMTQINTGNSCGESAPSTNVSAMAYNGTAVLGGVSGVASTTPALYPDRGVMLMYNFSGSTVTSYLDDTSSFWTASNASGQSTANAQGWLNSNPLNSSVYAMSAMSEGVASGGITDANYLRITPNVNGDPIIGRTLDAPLLVDTQMKVMIRMRIVSQQISSPVQPEAFGSTLCFAWTDTLNPLDTTNTRWSQQSLIVTSDWATYTFKPAWNGTVGTVAIELQNLGLNPTIPSSGSNRAYWDIDYIAFVSDKPNYKITNNLTPIRVAVQNTRVQMWVGRSEKPIFDQNNFLSLATTNSEIKIGKLNTTDTNSSWAWGGVKFLTSGALAPVTKNIQDFRLQWRLPNTGGVRQLIEHNGTLWALTDAATSYRISDSLSDRQAKAFSYVPDKQVWMQEAPPFSVPQAHMGAIRPLAATTFNGTLLASCQLGIVD